MKRSYALMSLSLASLLATTACASSIRQGSLESQPATPPTSESASASATEISSEPVTLIGTVSVDGFGLRDLDGDAVVYINGEWIGSSDDPEAYLSYDMDREGGQVVFQAQSGDQVEFVTKNINTTSISCELTNENGVTLATDSAREMESKDDKYDIDEATCDLIVP